MTNRLVPIGIGLLLIASNGFSASDWGTLFADAVLDKNKEQVGFLLRSRVLGNTLSDVQETAKRLRERNSSIGVELLERAFSKSLSLELDDKNFTSYLSFFSEAENGTEFRILLVKPLLKSQGRLSREQNENLFSSLMSTLKSQSPSGSLKGKILRRLGKHPLAHEDDFLPFLDSQDSTLVESGYLALGDKIRANHLQGMNNREIFEKIRAKNPGKLSLPAVKAIARIGENYANEYLVEKCGIFPECIAAAIFQNGDTEPVGLVKASIGAYKFSNQSDSHLNGNQRRENELLRQSLLARLKTRERILDLLFGRSGEDRIEALKLLAILKDNVQPYENQIVSELNPSKKGEFILSMAALQSSPNYSKIVNGLLEKSNGDEEKKRLLELITESHRN